MSSRTNSTIKLLDLLKVQPRLSSINDIHEASFMNDKNDNKSKNSLDLQRICALQAFNNLFLNNSTHS